jgi:hypothetical protein
VQGLQGFDTKRCGAADWVEHVLETDGEPYLATPDEKMSFFALHSLDVAAAWLLIAVAAARMAYVIVRATARRLADLTPLSKHKLL